MIIGAIAAIDRHGLIGGGMKLPWHLPADLKRFRRATLGRPIIMGRRTFESIGSPLPGRLNIVVSRRPLELPEGCAGAGSTDEACEIAERQLARDGGDEAMIIGGGVIYERTAARWDRLLLTVVDGDFAGDTYFPVERATGLRWALETEEACPADAKNPHPHRFAALRRAGAAEPAFDLAAWIAAGPTQPSNDS